MDGPPVVEQLTGLSFRTSRPLVTAVRVLPREGVTELAAPGDGSDPNMHRAPSVLTRVRIEEWLGTEQRSAWKAEATTVALTN